MDIYQPYFYIIHFPDIDKRYAGIRFARGCHPNELLVKYKTSSKVVHKLLTEGHKPTIETILLFNDIDLLRDYEVDFLLPRISKPEWLNKAAGKAIINDAETRRLIGSYFTGRKLSLEHRAAIGRSGLGRKQSFETIEKRRLSRIGKPNPEAALRMTGRVVSQETRDKISASKKGKPLTENQIAGIEKSALMNKGKKRSTSTRDLMQAKARQHWQRVREQTYRDLDLDALAMDLRSMLKKDIYKKYGISRHCFKENILPLI